ncbi:MAG: VWA domain-containing protein [Thermoplasmata archaeon]|nr:VWA domain-containing protein [Thermoplasmata archaeon]
MGIGRHKDGKFDLVLSLRHDADNTRIEQWMRSFKRASRILFDSTDGQMQYGRLFVANKSMGSDEADAWLLQEEGTSSSFVDALGTSGLHMNLKSDEKNKPFVIIHEFGHYGFGLYDEYTGPGGSAECTGDPTTGACIMEHGWWDGDQIDDDGNLTEGDVNEFCTDVDHDPDSDTDQEDIHGEPCWETIQDNYPEVDVPAGLPDAPVPAGHEEVDWILLAEDPRIALVLDKSGSMSLHNAIAGVRLGADYWTNFLAQTGDSLAIVAYDNAQNVILPLTAMTDTMDLSGILNSIAAISSGGTTNIGGAMSEGVGQITSPGDRAATQVMVLFSDGRHNTGTPPEDVLGDMVENGIRAYTVGFGPYADQTRLQEIAEATGGRFEQIDADPDTPDAQLEIQNYLIEISGEVRDGSGIVTMSPGLLPEPTANEREEATKISALHLSASRDIKMLAKRPLAFRTTTSGFDHKAYIEVGSTRATFVASHKEGTSLNFALIRPNGDVVIPKTDPDAVFVNPENRPYTFYVINNPTHGHWIMRITRAQASGEIPFKVFAFSDNRDIAVGLRGIKPVFKVDDKILIRAQIYNKVPLTDILNPVVRVPPRDYVTTLPTTKPIRATLRQRMTQFDIKGTQLERPIPVRNGVYEGELSFDEPGSYSVVVRFTSTGKAMEAEPEAERRREGEEEEKFPPAPVFVRTRRFQIHVGPLSTGKDVETAGGGTIPGWDLARMSFDISGTLKVNTQQDARR